MELPRTDSELVQTQSSRVPFGQESAARAQNITKNSDIRFSAIYVNYSTIGLRPPLFLLARSRQIRRFLECKSVLS